MKIRIKENASIICARKYSSYLPKEAIDWIDKLTKIQGMVLEVDTEFVFSDQYNTYPIEGVSENGMRITNEYVDEVIYD